MEKKIDRLAEPEVIQEARISYEAYWVSGDVGIPYFRYFNQQIQKFRIMLRVRKNGLRSSSPVHDMVPWSRKRYSKWTRHDLIIPFRRLTVKCRLDPYCVFRI